LLNAYLPNLKVVIARDDAGVIHGFLGVDENRIEMLFVDDASRGKGVGKLLQTRHRRVRRERSGRE
jgi:putative acetyltransferase